MDNKRLFIWGALAFVLFLNYRAWMTDHAPTAEPATASATSQAVPAPGQATAVQAPLGDAVPTLDSATTPASSTGNAAGTAPAAAAATTDTVHVLTDVLDVEISLIGGDLIRADLPLYPLHKNEPGVPVRLFNTGTPETLFVLESGLASADPAAAPNHHAHFSSAAREYRLTAGADQLAVPLTWSNAAGVTVTKTFVFTRGLYQVNLRYDVHNPTQQPWQAASYAQLRRHSPPVTRSMFDTESYSFRGPEVYDGEKARKLKLSDDKDSKFLQSVTDGWLGALQHHFVAAIVPAARQAYRYAIEVRGDDFVLSARGPTKTVAGGADGQFTETLYFGPKLQAQLEKAGPRLDLAADYGRLTPIAKPLFIVLSWVHGIFGNWGWAIVFTTILIKACFYWLSQKSGRSMAKMRNLAPRMKALQERYKDSKEQLGREMLDLYKKEKVNPAAGCLPMLVQIPFFLAFYWVLLESVEMRQAPFGLWIQDLSSRDPFYVLPILNGLAMFGQYKLNPTPPDPIQAKVFMFMPLFMTFTFAWFPSGLVLYWVTNTVLSIAQQWNINRIVAAESVKRTG
jgi:YidC/Oxa1 family membrane protein insertase